MNNRLIIILNVIGWLVVFGWILNVNLAPFGSTALRWNNPTRPSSSFTWQQTPAIEDGHVVIAPNANARFSATLPRGFRTGSLEVMTTDTAQFRLSADTQSAEMESAKNVQSNKASLVLDWSKLVARGRTFSFEITNLGNATLGIDAIQLTAQR